MDLQHVNVKVHLASPAGVEVEAFIPVFHGWIQEQNFEELLIDVADYSHVPDGPGLVLIGHQADYSLDSTGGRLGLRYNRKAPLAGSNAGRFQQALRAALLACRRLEESSPVSGLRFHAGDLELFINDRALAPNTPATHAACEPELRRFFESIYGSAGFSLELDQDPRRRFGARVKAGGPVTLTAILGKLG